MSRVLPRFERCEQQKLQTTSKKEKTGEEKNFEKEHLNACGLEKGV
jgi:hypothetical protein